MYNISHKILFLEHLGLLSGQHGLHRLQVLPPNSKYASCDSKNFAKHQFPRLSFRTTKLGLLFCFAKRFETKFRVFSSPNQAKFQWNDRCVSRNNLLTEFVKLETLLRGMPLNQGVTKRCRRTLTNSALVYEPK